MRGSGPLPWSLASRAGGHGQTMISIHRYVGSPELVAVNAWLAEGPHGIVVVDGTLTVSGGRGVRERVHELGKPLVGVLVTHAHPDHYGGVAELVADDPVGVYAIPGVADALRRTDGPKEAEVRMLLGDEWPHQRRLPDMLVGPGEALELAGLTFTAIDLGPGESPHDSIWLLGDDRRTVFAGDTVYDHVHGYLAEGLWELWLAQLERLRAELPANARLYPGHGEVCGLELLAWQEQYVRVVVEAVRAADWREPQRARAAVLEQVMRFLPTQQLRFLLEESLEPLAKVLATDKLC